MSRQVNFYAAPADTEMIHSWLLSEFPELTLVSQRRGPLEHTIPIDASKPGAFWHYPVSLLVPVWAKLHLHAEELSPARPNQFRIRVQDNPVIEYQPCPWDEWTKTVTRSRFFWAYAGDISEEARRQVDKLFRWVQRNTVSADGPFWRFFPAAAQSAHFARQELDWEPEPNPLFSAP